VEWVQEAGCGGIGADAGSGTGQAEALDGERVGLLAEEKEEERSLLPVDFSRARSCVCDTVACRLESLVLALSEH
jgi:hypothetical protein